MHAPRHVTAHAPGAVDRSRSTGAALGTNVLAPGQTTSLHVKDIPGYRNSSGLYVFTWRVRGDLVSFGPSFQWTNEQLRASGFELDLAMAVPFQ